MAVCFKLTVVLVSLFVCSQLDITHARPMSYSYSDLQRVLEALIQLTKPQPLKARLEESEAFNMGGHPSEVDVFEIEPGIMTSQVLKLKMILSYCN